MPLLYLENYTLIKDDKGRVVGYSFVLDGMDNSKEKKIPNVYIGEEIEFFTEQVKIPISSLEKKSLLDLFSNKISLIPAILCRDE